MQSLNIGVLIVDQYPVIRWGLQQLFKSHTRIRILGEAASIHEALDLASTLRPEITVIDLCIPEENGMAVISRLARDTETRVLCFGSCETWHGLESFLRAGGMGFVAKRCPPDELISAVLAVAEGQRWISPSLTEIYSSTPNYAVRLSPREREVVRLVARGLTSQQIADHLNIRVKTVEMHRYRIFKLLNIRNLAQLVCYAIDNGLL